MVYNHTPETANYYVLTRKSYYTLKNRPKCHIWPTTAVLSHSLKNLKGRIWRTNDVKKLQFSGFSFLYEIIITEVSLKSEEVIIET